jgi:hypothetical protein
MDIGDVVNWGTFAYWVFLALVWGGKIWRGEATMHPLVKKMLASNVLMGALILVGVLGQGGTLYLDYTRNHVTSIDDLTISAYPIEGRPTQPFQLVKDQTFENESVPLDWHVYDHCVFINSCLLYDGGPYQIQHSSFRSHSKVCVRVPELKNYSDLMDGMKMYRSDIKRGTKSVMMTAPK